MWSGTSFTFTSFSIYLVGNLVSLRSTSTVLLLDCFISQPAKVYCFFLQYKTLIQLTNNSNTLLQTVAHGWQVGQAQFTAQTALCGAIHYQQVPVQEVVSPWILSTMSSAILPCTQSISLEQKTPDRNPLWTPSDQTSRPFFFQNSRPSIFSVLHCYIHLPQVCCLFNLCVNQVFVQSAYFCMWVPMGVGVCTQNCLLWTRSHIL